LSQFCDEAATNACFSFAAASCNKEVEPNGPLCATECNFSQSHRERMVGALIGCGRKFFRGRNDSAFRPHMATRMMDDRFDQLENS
jgi:hypothetical protein